MFRIEANQVPRVGEIIAVTGPEAKHAINVRRMRLGEPIQLSDGKGLRVRGAVSGVEGSVLSVQAHSVEVEVAELPNVTLVQALAKGDRDELAVQTCTEIGISTVIPWQAARSVSVWDSSKASKGQARWQTIATEATKQSLQAFEPVVAPLVTTKQLCTRVSDFDLVLVLDPTSPVSLASFEIGSSAKIALIVGPEGGITDSELAELANAGAKRVHLGSNILRTSTAGAVALTIIRASAGRFD